MTSRNARKPRPSWFSRCAEIAEFKAATGALPTRTSNTALTGWLYDQHSRLEAGKLSAEQASAFRELAPGFAPRPKSRNRLEQLEAFYRDHGRLPGRSVTDPAEKALNMYLVMDLRTRIRTGRISPADLARAEAIPGAAVIRSVPDQDALLESLTEYVNTHSLMPVQDGEHDKLTRWVTNNTKGDPETKSPALRARHLAIEELRSRTTTRADASLLQRLAEAETFCAEHGVRPGAASHLPLSERQLADWLSRRISAGPASMPDELSARRLTALMAVPTYGDVRWREHLLSLKDYVRHNGSLPTRWDQPNYNWLAVQRRDFRAGIMPEWKSKELHAVPGLIIHYPRAA